MDGLNGTNICASATIGAYVRIDLIDIALGNGLNGTFIDAGTASSAIFRNFISHGLKCFVSKILRAANIFII
jgi:hypothetical protein